VKNIAKNVCEKHLVSVFGKYNNLQNTDIVYRYMKRGKMKGQAFIEFESEYYFIEIISVSINLYLQNKMVFIIIISLDGVYFIHNVLLFDFDYNSQ